MLKKVSFIFLFFYFFVLSCDTNYVIDTYETVEKFWEHDKAVQFNFTAPDSINNYALFINLRNNKDYRYSNLFLIAELNYPNGKTLVDTLEYQMAKPNGEFLGTGFSDLKENKLWYKAFNEPFVFEELGNYQLSLKHAMRKNGDVEGIKQLEGITDIGFRIEALNTKNNGN